MLFFTNFVAIVISTCIVFLIYGFRPRTITDEDVTHLKRRVILLGLVLLVISIPLFYTLHKSITEIKLRKDIREVLKQNFDREGFSHLSTFNYLERNGKLDISVVVNTRSYLKEAEIQKIENQMKNYLQRDIALHLEQVQVQAGGLKEEAVKPPTAGLAPPKPPAEIISSSRENVVGVVRQSVGKIEKIISPATVEDFYVGFQDKTFKVPIVLKIKRDTPFSADEVVWLTRILTTDLNVPVELKVETRPFVPPLLFKKRETNLSEAMKTSLIVLKEIYQKTPDIVVKVESYPEAGGEIKNDLGRAWRRARAVEGFLTRDCRLPAERIRVIVPRSRRLKIPEVKITVASEQKSS